MSLSLIQSPHISPLERLQIRFIRWSFGNRTADSVLRWCQRNLGAPWLNAATRNLLRVHGRERLPALDPTKSFLCVSNHRSFFDLYVITAYLVGQGMPHRLVFPVRSAFFYDHPLGFLVNGAMSFFAMYPPVFRDRKRAALNVASLDEVVRLLEKGGVFLGLHPEGKRNKGDDPYTLLPAQSGIGRILHRTRVSVIPVFINGLTNSMASQVWGNVTKKGPPVTLTFGKPIEFGALLDEPASPRLYQKLADRSLEAIQQLSNEERVLRQRIP